MTNSVSKTVSDETLNSIITIESAGNPNAKARTSTATGLGQFIAATWINVIKKHRPDLAQRYGRDQLLKMRTNPHLAIEILARFTEDNQRAIGMNCTGGDLYLAHFLGVGDARNLFRANPAGSVVGVVTNAAIAANPSILRGKTAGQVRAWAAKKMAKSGGNNWVAKYYKAPQPVALVSKEIEEGPVKEETVEDIPDTQAQVIPASLPEPSTPLTPERKESFLAWVNRKRKVVSGWVTGGGTGIGIASYLTDWRVVAVVVGGLIVAGSMAYIFWLLARKR